MDFTIYWFMFPTAIAVSSVAMMSGIAGTALFIPIFLLVFPLLGVEYAINSPAQMVTAALLTSTFGFASGFIRYNRQKLIDFNMSKAFLPIAIGAAISGAVLNSYLNMTALRLIYGLIIIGLAYLVFSSDKAERIVSIKFGKRTELIDAHGKKYLYKAPMPNFIFTVIGGLMTGLLSVGIGETTLTQLSKVAKVPVPVAAATSVVVVICTLMSASVIQVGQLIYSGGITNVPWHLVIYTIPGVLLGGQIGPMIHGYVSTQIMQKFIAIIFLFIGLLMFAVVVFRWM